MDKKFLFTTNEEVANALKAEGFRLISDVDSRYVFINDIKKYNRLFEKTYMDKIKRSDIGFTNTLFI